MPDAIQIQVIEARNLKSADLFSKSDPYAELTILGQMHSGKTERTKTIWNNNSPVWNESFTLYPESLSDSLRIQLYDKDVGTKDDYLGEVTVPLSRYHNKGQIDDWLPVTGKGGKHHLLGREKGEVHIKVTYGKGQTGGSMMPQPVPSQQPMAPSNPQKLNGKATEYLGPANPAAAAALNAPKPAMGGNSGAQQPPPYPGIKASAPPMNPGMIAPPKNVGASAPPLYPPIQPSTASAQYPPPPQQSIWGPGPPQQSYPPVQYPPSMPPPQQYPQYPQYPPQYPPPMNQGMYPPTMPPPQQGYGNPLPPSGFNPIPPFM